MDRHPHDVEHDHAGGYEHANEKRGILGKLLETFSGHHHGVEGS